MSRVLLAFLIIILLNYYGGIVIQDFKVAQVRLNKIEPTKPITEIFQEYKHYPPLEELLVKSYKEKLYSCEILLDLAKNLLELNPRSIQSDFITAACLDEAGDFVSARDVIRRSLKFDPNNTSTLINYAIIELKLGNFDSCKKILDKIELIDSNAPSLQRIQLELSTRAKSS